MTKVKRVKKKLILELLMGDPLTSFQMNKFGVSVGTSLGRISSYIFNDESSDNNLTDNNKLVENNRKPDKRGVDLVIEVKDEARDSRPTKGEKETKDKKTNLNKEVDVEVTGKYYVFSSYQDDPVVGVNLKRGKLNTIIGLRRGIVFDVANYCISESRQIPSQRSELDRVECRRQILQNDSLVLVVGSQTIRLFDLSGSFPFYHSVSPCNTYNYDGDKNNSEASYRGGESSSASQTKSSNSDNSMNSSLDGESLSVKRGEEVNSKKEELNSEKDVNNVFFSNLMFFRFPYVLSVGYDGSGGEKTVYLYKIVQNALNAGTDDNLNNDSNKNNATSKNGGENNSNENRQREYWLVYENSLVVDRKVHMVTQCSKWRRFVVLVNDLDRVLVFKNVNNSYKLANERKMSHDVLSLNCNFEKFFLVLTKNSKLHCLDRDLNTLSTLDLSPSTFELGWSYSVLNFGNVIAYNCDEGVYLFELPQI